MKLNQKITTSAVSVAAMAAMGTTAYAQDFTGPYIGAFAGLPNGSYPSTDDNTYGFETGFAAGGFIGFNLESNRGAIFGFEVAVHGTTLHDDDNDYDLQYLTDFKVKIGKPINAFGSSMLVYGFTGVSIGSATTSSLDEAYFSLGPNVGIGAEYMVSDKISVGLEHTQRFMTGHYTEGALVSNGTTAFRVAVHF